MLPAGEKIDPTLLPRVGIDDLEKRGRTELVTVVLPLTNLTAKDLAPDVKKMLGPFGEIVMLEKANQFIAAAKELGAGAEEPAKAEEPAGEPAEKKE